jgi:hypothetical protein
LCNSYDNVLPPPEAKGSYHIPCTSLWLPAEAALSVSNVRFLLKPFLEELDKIKMISTNAIS